jgi:hypothetical protein
MPNATILIALEQDQIGRRPDPSRYRSLVAPVFGSFAASSTFSLRIHHFA